MRNCIKETRHLEGKNHHSRPRYSTGSCDGEGKDPEFTSLHRKESAIYAIDVTASERMRSRWAATDCSSRYRRGDRLCEKGPRKMRARMAAGLGKTWRKIVSESHILISCWLCRGDMYATGTEEEGPVPARIPGTSQGKSHTLKMGPLTGVLYPSEDWQKS